MNCKNCDSKLHGPYCHECGQKYIDNRFTLKDSLAAVANSIFNFDRGFLYTSRMLTLQPGKVVKDILSGITIRYTHPFRFLFIWATINTVILVSTGVFDLTQDSVYQKMDVAEEQREMQLKARTWIKQYISLFNLLLLPFLSLLSYGIYRRKKWHYAEHLILNSYSLALSTILSFIPLLLFFLYPNPNVFTIGGIFLSLLAASYVYSKVFEENFLKAFFRYLVIFSLGYLIFLSVIIVLFILVLLILIKSGNRPDWMPVKQEALLFLEGAANFLT
jgi:VIT1/CCC1 family predicted Fe2+/Mn2+ transporter